MKFEKIYRALVNIRQSNLGADILTDMRYGKDAFLMLDFLVDTPNGTPLK
jgi:hypothetical protein